MGYGFCELWLVGFWGQFGMDSDGAGVVMLVLGVAKGSGCAWLFYQVVEMVVGVVAIVVVACGCGRSLIGFWCGWVSMELWFVWQFLADLGHQVVMWLVVVWLWYRWWVCGGGIFLFIIVAEVLGGFDMEFFFGTMSL